MTYLWLVELLVGLLPVLLFLGALVLLESYKLVQPGIVVGTVAAGGLVAGVSYLLNGAILSASGLDMTSYSHWVAPMTEELLKGSIVIILIRMGRIAFLVDAAIFGFAVGAGFSVAENLYYLVFIVSGDAGMGTWIIRGFGTATMHGGATAILALTSLNFQDRPGIQGAVALVPGFGLAYAVHSLYNHALLPPIYETFVILLALPLLLAVVFRQSEKALGDWLGSGFDADAQLLELLNSGQFTDSPLGKYLMTLRQKFHGPVVADILCYVKLHTELALRAKGILLMRENGFDVPVDPEVNDKFAELRYLEGSIGKTGQMAIRPMLHFSRKDLRQLYLL